MASPVDSICDCLVDRGLYGVHPNLMVFLRDDVSILRGVTICCETLDTSRLSVANTFFR